MSDGEDRPSGRPGGDGHEDDPRAGGGRGGADRPGDGGGRGAGAAPGDGEAGDAPAAAVRTVSTGVPGLDGMLGGGFPARRATLVAGDHGTGKSTLAMQFLQAGLAAGDRCLYVSTEQTVAELRDSFRPYDFDMDHEDLAFTSVHATPGRTLESDEAITLQTLEGEQLLGQGFSAPFESRYVEQHLERFAPRDRVVVDSVSGLAALGDGPVRYRRTVLDLIRLFTDEFRATTLFTAEDADPTADGDGRPATDAAFVGDPLRFSTHAVLRLFRRYVDEDPHRYLRVEKVRGVDHDRRAVEVSFSADGLRVAPRRRSRPPALKHHRHVPTGIHGLDALVGGGLVRGDGVHLEHDGRADVSVLLGTLLSATLDGAGRSEGGGAADGDAPGAGGDAATAGDGTTTGTGAGGGTGDGRGSGTADPPTGDDAGPAVALTPGARLRPDRLRKTLAGRGYDLDRLFESDRLFVYDAIGAWNADHPNVFSIARGLDAAVGALDRVEERTGGPALTVLDVDPLVHRLGAEAVRELRYDLESRIDRDSGLLTLATDDGVPDTVAGLHVDAAGQVLRTWLTDDGLQYLSLRKSPCGFVGSTSLVEFSTEAPYLRVQDPPNDRENPMTAPGPDRDGG